MSKGSKAELQKREAFLAQALKTLESEVQMFSANNSRGFITTFQEIESRPHPKSLVSTKPENKKLNRYMNILSYDHSRVKIKPSRNNNNNDYVNANYLKGADGKPTYIATQAPIPEGFPGFWQMIWEQGVQVIVMVTNEVEGGKLKCHRYWPDQSDDVVKFNDFSIRLNFQEVFPTHVRRSFSLAFGREVRDVTQYAFTAWPDHGVPSTTQELLTFRSEVRKSWEPKNGRVAVHCSAGVGRTGTFIALDRFLETISLGKYMPLLDIVNNLREDRNFMVQAQIQFVYLYHIALDGVHELLMDTQKQLRRINMSEAERHEDLVREIQNEVEDAATMLGDEIEQGEDNLEERYRKAPESFPAPLPPRPKSRVASPTFGAPVPAAAAAAPEPQPYRADRAWNDSKYTDDIDKAHRVPFAARAASLAEVGSPEAQFWRTRRNVAITAREKGYHLSTAVNIDGRLESLDKAVQEAWRKRYETARQKWEEIMDEGGEVYDIHHQMTPLESRLESLQAAEEAWRYRGDGMRSAHEEDVRLTLARLSQRLQSLHETLLLSEARWRAKGDGMRQLAVVPEGTRVNTTERLGGLMERLEMLEKEEKAWAARDNWTRFDRAKFEGDVKSERARQERELQDKEAVRSRLEKEREQEAAAAAEQAARQLRIAEDARREEERRELVKEKMKKASMVEPGYDPARERNGKQKQKEDEEREKSEAAAREAAAKREEQERAEAKKKQIEDAKEKASRFLGKLKA